MKKVAFLIGSKSDLPRIQKGLETLVDFDVPFELVVMSAHRVPEQVAEFSGQARSKEFGVIICAAGMAAHLAGAVAARCTLPVIGIPVSSGSLLGIDALLSTVQMPSGIPVACVGIDAAANAAILAVQILALSDPALVTKLEHGREEGKQKIAQDNRDLKES
ncbi:MAG: 5-(carboxyamino)imidazole ribonucleotide mutase [Candidatus Wallbacteria bacterium]|nr:5-(carboxyamino)imidazole ribonucleotide mutase [Candidatus Wallbacteria bacterium]